MVNKFEDCAHLNMKSHSYSPPEDTSKCDDECVNRHCRHMIIIWKCNDCENYFNSENNEHTSFSELKK